MQRLAKLMQPLFRLLVGHFQLTGISKVGHVVHTRHDVDVAAVHTCSGQNLLCPYVHTPQLESSRVSFRGCPIFQAVNIMTVDPHPVMLDNLVDPVRCGISHEPTQILGHLPRFAKQLQSVSHVFLHL